MFPPVGGAVAEEGEQVAAVVVEQRVRGVHAAGAAEGVDFWFVDVVGPADPVGEQRVEGVVVRAVKAARVLPDQVPDAPGAFADEEPGGDEAVGLSGGQDTDEVADGLAFTLTGVWTGVGDVHLLPGCLVHGRPFG
jgi:hypothetical protein